MKPNKKDQVSQAAESTSNQKPTQEDNKEVTNQNKRVAKEDNPQPRKATWPDSKKAVVASGTSKEEMETAAAEKDRSNKADDAAQKVDATKKK